MSERSAADRRAELVRLYHQLSDCHDCPLHESRTSVVFGSGNADADLMFVGEAPGVNEDKQGKPFVGQAGKLLDKLLEEIGLRREEAFITNVLKCRPPGNRDPRPEEIESCTPYLMRQVELIRPRVICTLGNFATKLLRAKPDGITRVHGKPQLRTIGDVTVTLYPIFHPAAALYTPAMLASLREDFARLPALLASAAPAPIPVQTPDDEPIEAAAPDVREPAAQLGLFA